MITSTQNTRIKWVRALSADASVRRLEQAFVVDGVRLVEEALASDWPARLVLFSPDISERGLSVVEGFRARGVELEETTPAVMKSTSDAQHPQGILAVISQKPTILPDRLDFILILDGLRDPGNLGTILRSASAAGAQAVLMSPGGVDPYAPKVLRAAMGAHFRLPVMPAEWDDIKQIVAEAQLKVFLADSKAALPYTDADFLQKTAILVGSEAAGAGREGRALAGETICIPMPGGGESLNAASAAAVLLFEVARQRGARSQ